MGIESDHPPILAPTPLLSDRVAEHLKRLIVREHRPGDRLPSEPRLEKQLAVSRDTVRAALKKLARAGLIVRQQGRGTFVAERRVFTFGLITLLFDRSLRSRTRYGAAFLKRLCERAAEEGHDVAIFPREEGKDPKHVPGPDLRRIGSSKVDLWIVHGVMDEPYFTALAELGAPIVACDYRPHLSDVDSIVTDSLAAGYRVGHHLAQRGHERILYVGSLREHSCDRGVVLRRETDSVLRETGLRLALDAHDRPWDPALAVYGLGGEPPGKRVAAAFDGDRPPTAIVCDGLGFIEALRPFLASRNLRVPRDVSLAAFAGDWAPPRSRRTVTHYTFSEQTMAEFALARAGEILRRGPGETVRLAVRGRLVEHGSTAMVPRPAFTLSKE